MDNQIKQALVTDLKPYENNARTHSEDHIKQIVRSIEEFGFTNPVLVDGAGGIIAGHGRVLAAMQMGLETVPTLCLDHLTDEQKRAYILADNKLALNAGWDEDLLRIELGELQALGYDSTLTGFSAADIEAILADKDLSGDNPYTNKIIAQTYNPSDKKPDLSELYDSKKRDDLQEVIKAADIPEEDKVILMEAANRHTVFNYQKIADYYAHSGPDVQALMEASALIIIDFNQAIEQGYVRLSKDIAAQYAEEYSDV